MSPFWENVETITDDQGNIRGGRISEPATCYAHIKLNDEMPGLAIHVLADCFVHGEENIGGWFYREGELIATVEGRVAAWHFEGFSMRQSDAHIGRSPK